ncbi:hypothetical protein [Natrialba asiatica]|uniref:Uncharacterized protein n=1 Tax=Natrialba asiatica (strain ATCC 700177 / DSM 12278 / JCM 9576 / FERM P-10747 / NBRC 102637 / 172P1) TaxID=29540 RepID=M0AQQ9_NATA1|nr:hypothetical protein [Natrialba asiatica]ELZ00657.1 hypothetical protein C481_13474 [Natrialba asiatica DSM 12278]
MSIPVRAVLLIVLGIGLLVNPFYLWPHHPDAYELRAGEVDIVSEPTTVVPIDSLPTETAVAVKGAIETADAADDLPDGWYHEDQGGGHDWPRYGSRESVPTDGLFEHTAEVVTADDTTYTLSIVKMDRSPPLLPESYRVPVGFAGALALTLGAMMVRHGTPQLTPRNAWAVVGVWTAVLFGTAAYDGSFSGVALTTVREIPLVGTELPSTAGAITGTAVWILPAIGLVLGVCTRRERWRSGVGGVGELCSVLAFATVTWPFTLSGAALGFLIGQDRE